MKFTIKEMNVLVRGLHLALEEAKREDREYNTPATNAHHAFVSKLHQRVDDKLWKRVKKAEDKYWVEHWEWANDDSNMPEPGADGMYDPIDETK